MNRYAYSRPGTAVLVTGAAGGIGRALSLKLAHDGFTVICSDVSADGLSDIVQLIRDEGGNATAVLGDISDERTSQSIAAAVRETGLELTGVVNNSGVGTFGVSLEETTLEEWNHIISVNLTSVFLVCKHMIPLLRSSGGAIVNVSSIHAFASSTGVTPYAASKTGVMGLTRALALDLADDAIRVIGVAPGAIDTPLLQSHAAREGTTIEGLGFPSGEFSIGRVGRPEEAAATIAFLLSDAATLLTGTTFLMDAGKLAAF